MNEQAPNMREHPTHCSQDGPATPLPPATYPQPSQEFHGWSPRERSHSQSTPDLQAKSEQSIGPDCSTADSSLAPPKLLSTYLLKHPDHPVEKAINHEFHLPNPLLRLFRRFKVKHSVISGLTEQEIEKWENRGRELRQRAGWRLQNEQGDGAVVSELFWKMYISLLPTLERDPLSGLVPPDLLGSTTTMPLSVISLIPDIIQHYRDVIIRAEKEVFLATNYWQPSHSVNTITSSLRDLSARVIKNGRPKIVVKIMYDRGSFKQLWNAHAPVDSNDWAPLDLPRKEEIQGLDMEIINFHRVLLGTFHAKFLIVDRKVALINSNNIQDRPNLELMSHFEGPVVDAFYEIALHSWYNRLNPPLPCMSTPYQPPLNKDGSVQYLFQDHNPYFDDIEILKAAKAARILLRKQMKDDEEAKVTHHEGTTERLVEAVRKVMDQQRQSLAEWKPGEELEARAQGAMRELREFKERWSLGMGNMIGSSNRTDSRGPSRRPSKEKHHGEKKNRYVPTSSEANSSPIVTAGFPKSKTHPVPNDTRKDKGAISTTGDWIHDDINVSYISRPSLEEIKTEESNKPKPAFASLNVDDNDGFEKFLGNGTLIESPIASTINLNDMSGRSPIKSVTPEDSTPPEKQGYQPENGTIPEEDTNITVRPYGRTLERKANSVPTVGINVSSPAILGETIHPSSNKERNGAFPLSAQEPSEMGYKYAKIKETVVTDETSGRKSMEKEVQPEGTGSKRMFQLSKKFNAGAQQDAWATVEDSDELDAFSPHVVHAPHDPFPIAMCCRKPHGFPGHHDIRNPQNAAWLAGFRYAKKKVFIQTPTLNARPIVRAVRQACQRGVDVILLLDLGFNDKGESIPFQGGTNEEVVNRLYKKLIKKKKQQYLKVYWYTGKDQVRPLNAVKRQRNCHIKLAAYDDEVMIIGNGNQDSQSWFHSQEINVMIDNKQVVSEMMDTLLSNQNTIKYGGVDSDGVWRDKDGHTLEHYGATGGGAFRGLSAFIAFAKSI
ncbi:uncharacterized protein L203_102871 [Cryptococcus depauperatus CBS 7841]|uniref:Uncharacterized protein n=1 Tax=Cryptococcus depauperatus CBS 7841 TaxID=1295531 RepID=A0A1E3ID01_9TREE|nr:hypothetical protein L203_04676 [Cryptococcus depauperatus CBS 7841]